MSYDTRCLDLAKHFLKDSPAYCEENEAELAQAIQNTIESELEAMEAAATSLTK